jgi:hypothetical protein
MSGFVSLDLGTANPLVSSDKTRWKPEKGIYRVSFISLPGLAQGNPDFSAKAPQFQACKRLYSKALGYFLDNGPEFEKFSEQPSRLSVGTTLVFWPVDNKGAIDKGRLAAGDFKVNTWIMSKDKYQQLVDIHADNSLVQKDLKITVSDPTFHKMTFVPCGDSILLNVKEKMPELFARVVQFASVVENGLTKDLGQDLTLDEIKARLAEKGGSTASVPAKFDKEFDADSMLDDIIGK